MGLLSVIKSIFSSRPGEVRVFIHPVTMMKESLGDINVIVMPTDLAEAWRQLVRYYTLSPGVYKRTFIRGNIQYIGAWPMKIQLCKENPSFSIVELCVDKLAVVLQPGSASLSAKEHSVLAANARKNEKELKNNPWDGSREENDLD